MIFGPNPKPEEEEPQDEGDEALDDAEASVLADEIDESEPEE